MTGNRQRIGTRVLASLAAACLAGCTSAVVHDTGPASQNQRLAILIQPTGSFLTVTSTFDVTRPGGGPGEYKLIKYGVATLQVRSAKTGRVIATLLHSLGTVNAVRAADGSVLAVVNLGCRSQVLRIDPVTTQAALIRTLHGSAQQPALSPNGRELAFLTYSADQPQPCAPSQQLAHPILKHITMDGPGPIINVLAIVNLSSGATVSASTGYTYNWLDSPTWSPDGTKVAVTYGQHSIEVVSPSHPEFVLPPPIRSAKGCVYGSAAWTLTGLVVLSGCGGPFPQRLLQLSPTGQQSGSWQLPACLDGALVHADPAAKHVLVQMDVGYGTFAPCGDPNHPGVRTTRIAQIRGDQLAPIATYAPTAAEFYITGW